MGSRSGFLAGLVALGLLVGAADVRGQTWRTVTTSRQLADHSSLDVAVTYGEGRFELRPADESVLYRTRLRYDEEVFEPVTEFDDGRLRVGTRGIDGNFRLTRNRSGAELDLRLSRDVVLDLRLELGAVRTTLELGGLSISDLSIATGASESRIAVSEPNSIRMERARMEVGAADFRIQEIGNLNVERLQVDAGVGDVVLDFTGQWRDDAVVAVNMGLGRLRLRFPRDLGVKLEREAFLTSLDAGGLENRGDAYYSPEWEGAERRITVEVSSALGSVQVEWID